VFGTTGFFGGESFWSQLLLRDKLISLTELKNQIREWIATREHRFRPLMGTEVPDFDMKISI
jgi:hypothetical protein